MTLSILNLVHCILLRHSVRTHCFKASLLNCGSWLGPSRQIFLPLHILINLHVYIVVLLKDHVLKVPTSSLHLAFDALVGQLLHLARSLLLVLEPFDAILHALQLGALLDHFVVIVEHLEAFLVHAPLAPTQCCRRMLHRGGGHGAWTGCDCCLVLVHPNSQPVDLVSVYDAWRTGHVLAELERLDAGLAPRSWVGSDVMRGCSGWGLSLVIDICGRLRNFRRVMLDLVFGDFIEMLMGIICTLSILGRGTPITILRMLSQFRYWSLGSCRCHSYFLRRRALVLLKLLLGLEISHF